MSSELKVYANFVLGIVTLVVGAVVGALAGGIKKAAEGAAEKAVSAANWSREMAGELEKSRGLERQELRFKSCGRLWAQLRPLAIYDAAIVDRTSAAELSNALTDWYFSECGGLLLTSHAREFYFALQDLLRKVGEGAEWTSARPAETPATVFRRLLEEKEFSEAIRTLDGLSSAMLKEWPEPIVALSGKWRSDIGRLSDSWYGLTSDQRFAVLQQTGSVLRTTLAKDVESRLR